MHIFMSKVFEIVGIFLAGSALGWLFAICLTGGI
jgi:hypothetical protein